jgi:4-carboxymuconolactone decarboxylase
MTLNEKSPSASDASREARYDILPNRMPPIPTDKMTDAQRKVATEIAAGPRGKVEGPYWPIIRSPGLTESLQKVGEYYRYRCPLDRKLNEMAALMAARAWTQQFEWDVHILQALDAGLKKDIALAIAEGRRPAGMAEDEAILYDFVMELLINKGISDPTYARTVAKFGESGVIDIVGIVGYYTLLAMVMNVARTPLLEGRPFPLAPTPIQLRPLAGSPLRS